ncbi:hypothetical protein H377_4110 [Rickettsia prowazekii str. Cairo 3]|nr:hypothetical protein H377_4110 [Rickettsia prowazekii str. Cairo 3]
MNQDLLFLICNKNSKFLFYSSIFYSKLRYWYISHIVLIL